MNKEIILKFTNVLVMGILLALNIGVAAAQNSAEIDALVKKAIDAKAIPSAGIAVVKDGRIVLTKSYGMADTKAGTLADEETSYQIASVTKQFTAVAVMMLVEDRKLSLNDTVGKHLPDVPTEWHRVTIRQLLNQVSGIPDYATDNKLVFEKAYTSSEILAIVKNLPRAFEPGAEHQYSNTNYYLLGMIIEKISGKQYAEFMQKRVFKPLGMDSTVVNTSGMKIKHASAGYVLDGGSWKGQVQQHPSHPWAAGAIVSTPADMARWVLAQGETKLLRQGSWEEIWTAGKLLDGRSSGYGFGWRTGKLGDTEFWHHGGSIAGFQSYVARFPNDKLSIVVLTNSNSRVPEQLAMDIAALFVPKLQTALAARRAAANADPIQETDPETTKFLRSAFEGMVTGEIEPVVFNAEMQGLLFPDRIKEMKGRIGNQGAIKAFELMKAGNIPQGKLRVYRITFEGGLRLAANFEIDREGKISNASFRPER